MMLHRKAEEEIMQVKFKLEHVEVIASVMLMLRLRIDIGSNFLYFEHIFEARSIQN